MFSITPRSCIPVCARHLRGAARDLLREQLRRRHDDRLGAREHLAERDRDVAGAGRHVDDEHVELAPVDVLEELLERPVQHRPAPHQRLVVVDEEADRHQLQVVRDRRDHQPVDEHRLLLDPEHVRDRVAVDVGVEHADALARAREAPRRGWRSATTCRRRPCPRRRRSRASSGRAGSPCRRPAGRRGASSSAPRARPGLITSNSSRTAVDALDARRPRARPAPGTSCAAGSRRP